MPRAPIPLSQGSAVAWLVAAALASALMLAIAHAFETFGHYPPCELCLHQREGYWSALWIAVAGLLLARIRRSWASGVAVLLGVVFAVEAALAGFHAGVEWKWWPGPTSCTGHSARVDLSAIQAMMSGGPQHLVRCDEAAWRLLGLSMAGWNALIALALAVASFAAALMRRRPG
jgi:disulfide bond formation protein DsbB